MAGRNSAGLGKSNLFQCTGWMKSRVLGVLRVYLFAVQVASCLLVA